MTSLLTNKQFIALLFVIYIPISSLFAQAGNNGILLFENKTVKATYSLLEDEIGREYIDINSNVLGSRLKAYRGALLMPVNNEIMSYDVHRVEEYLEGIISVIGYDDEFQSSIVATFSNDNAKIRIRSHDGLIHKQTRYDSSLMSYYVATLKNDPGLLGCGNDELDHSNHGHGYDFIEQNALIFGQSVVAKYQSQRTQKVEIPVSEVTTVDIMYAFTDSAQAYAENYNNEGINTIEEYLAQTTALTQLVFDNSRLPVELRVVSLFNLEYDEINEPDSVSSYEWLYRLRDKGDGYMDDVHTERDRVGADLVVGIFKKNEKKYDYCGIANYASNLWGGADQYAFSVNLIHCSLYNQTVAHEIGHNFGVAHSRTQNSNAASIIGGQFPYSVGYQFVSTNRAFSTIMGYTQKMRTLSGDSVWSSKLEAFSTPELGITVDGIRYLIGDENNDAPVDARLNNLLSKDVIASFRPSRTDPPIISTVEGFSVNVMSGSSTSVSIPIKNAGSSRLMWNLRHKVDSEINILRLDSEELLFENFEVGFPLNSDEYLKNNWRAGNPDYYPPMIVNSFTDLLSESQSRKMTLNITSDDRYGGILNSPFLGYNESLITNIEMDLRFQPTSDFYFNFEPAGDEKGRTYIQFNESGVYLIYVDNDGVLDWKYSGLTYSDLFHHKVKMVINNPDRKIELFIDDVSISTLESQENKLKTRINHLNYYAYNYTNEQLQLSIDNVKVSRTKVNDFVSLDQTSGSIGAGEQATSSFTVDATDLSPGSYQIMLELLSNDITSPVVEIPLQINVSGSTVNEESIGLPDKLELFQNYPNPFNPTTTIRFGLPQVSEVKLEVYTLLGQRIAVLADGRRTQGWHTLELDGSQWPSGTYIYRLQAGGVSQVRSFTLIK